MPKRINIPCQGGWRTFAVGLIGVVDISNTEQNKENTIDDIVGYILKNSYGETISKVYLTGVIVEYI